MKETDDVPQLASKQKAGTVAQRMATREILLLCTTARLAPAAIERISQILAKPVDWEYLIELGSFQGVIALVTHNLAASGLLSKVPQPYENKLKRIYHSTVYRNIILSTELASVISAFQLQGVETVCLKGIVLAEVLYGNAYVRPVADLDILVHPQDRLKAGSILTGLGYKQLASQWPRNHPFHEEPYCKQAAFPVFVELHWDLEDQRLVAFPDAEIWSRTKPVQFQGITTLMLSPEDNLLFLANHLYKHDSQRLKFLGDISELLKKYEASLDWAYITSSAAAWQIRPAVYLALKRSQELLNAPVPDDCLKTLRPCGWRRWLLAILEGQESFVLQSKYNRMDSEALALAHSLMMRGSHEMTAVLSSHRRTRKRGEWFKTLFWIIAASAFGVGRRLVGLVTRQA